MRNPKSDALKRRTPGKGILLLAVGFALWTSGCAHTGQHNGFARGGAEALVPKLTSVTTWPLAVLLTNGNAYESEFTMTLGNAAESQVKLSGQLLVRGGKLRLEGAFEQANGKSLGMGDFGVIWDEGVHRGYVFSEALQGYAPMSAAVRCTNVLTQVMTGNIERIEGHPVDQANVTAMGSDGQAITVQLSRAQDLGKLPLKVDAIGGPHSFALALTKVRLITPAEELFLPSDGFTKYESQTAMLNELTAREFSVNGGKHEQIGGDDEDNASGPKRRFNNTTP